MPFVYRGFTKGVPFLSKNGILKSKEWISRWIGGVSSPPPHTHTGSKQRAHERIPTGNSNALSVSNQTNQLACEQAHHLATSSSFKNRKRRRVTNMQRARRGTKVRQDADFGPTLAKTCKRKR